MEIYWADKIPLSLRGVIQTYCATLNVDSTLRGVGADVKNVAVLHKLFFTVFRTKGPLQTRAKLTSIHFWFSNAPFMPFHRHRKIAELQPIQSDDHPL